jgi:hypothetical protein
MANVPRLDRKDDVLGDVGRVVSHPFEMARHQNKVDARFDDSRVSQHVRQQFTDDLIPEHLEPCGLPQNIGSDGHVAVDESVEGVSEQVAGKRTHARKVDQRFDGWMEQITLRGLGNVDRQVADTLQVGVDSQCRDDGSEIDGHRVKERQQAETAFIDLDLDSVELFVTRNDIRQRVTIASDQCVQRRAHARVRELPHREDAVFQTSQFVGDVRRLYVHEISQGEPNGSS